MPNCLVCQIVLYWSSGLYQFLSSVFAPIKVEQHAHLFMLTFTTTIQETSLAKNSVFRIVLGLHDDWLGIVAGSATTLGS
jgi:hypothetical protein